MRKNLLQIICLSIGILAILVGLVLGFVIENGTIFWKVFGISFGIGVIVAVVSPLIIALIIDFAGFVKRKNNSTQAMALKNKIPERTKTFIIGNIVGICLLLFGLVAIIIMGDWRVIIPLGIFCIIGIACCIYNIVKGE